jgi:hypothetical protein
MRALSVRLRMLTPSRQMQRVPHQIQSRGAKAPLQELWQRFLRVRFLPCPHVTSLPCAASSDVFVAENAPAKSTRSLICRFSSPFACATAAMSFSATPKDFGLKAPCHLRNL